MNEDEEADADDLASEVETDRTRQKARRDLAKFRRRLQERVQLLLRENFSGDRVKSKQCGSCLDKALPSYFAQRYLRVSL